MQDLDQAELDKLATPADIRAIRVILRQVNNHGPYVVNGRAHKYIFRFDTTLDAHKLDIPESVWMNGVPGGAYVDNESVCHDILANRALHLAPLVPLIVPMAGGKAETPRGYGTADAPPAEFLASLRALFTKMGAPPIVMEALDLADTGNAQLLAEFVADVDVSPPEPMNEHFDAAPPEQTAPGLNPEVVDRMEKMRLAKAAKKAARELATT